MKKFTISAIFAMALVALSSAAFAGTTSQSLRGFAGLAANDTVVPTDTVVPEKTDTAAPQKSDTTPANLYESLGDTVVPTDTVAPEKQEPTQPTEPTDTAAPQKSDTAK